MTTNRRIERIEGQLDDLWFWLFVIGGLLAFSIWRVSSAPSAPSQSQSSEQSTTSEPFQPSKDAPKFIYPHSSSYPITSGFGMRKHPIGGDQRMHNGLDFGSPMGTPILAVADGKIIAAGQLDGACGLGVKIEHSGGYSSAYCHASEVLAKSGQSVKAGDPIAKVGSTGGSTGPHLHLGIKLNGEWIDPKKVIPLK